MALLYEYSQLGRAVVGETRLLRLMEERICQAAGDPAAMNSLAWHLSITQDQALRDTKRATELARQAVAAKPAHASFWNTLGAALYRERKWTEAQRAFETSLALQFREPALNWYFLAAIAQHDGRADEARDLWQRATADHYEHHTYDDDHCRIAAELQTLLP